MSQVTPNVLNMTRVMTPDASHASPGLPGSDVLHPMSRASDDKFQSQFSYGSGVRDAPTTPAHTHTSSVSDNKVATKFKLKASQFLKLSMLINCAQERLRSHANLLGFLNVFNNPANECMLCAAIKKECSAIQNKFHTLLLDSTSQEEGKTCMMLEELTWTVLSKYRHGGVGSGSKAKYQLHFAFLHYYGRAHQYVVGRTVSDDSDLESGGEGAAQASAKGSMNKPPAKCVRTDLDQLGKDMKNNKWHEFFNLIITQDQELYGKNVGSILLPLPSMYTESPATVSSAPCTLPTPGNHRASHITQLSVIRQSSVTNNTSPQPACSEGLHAKDSNEDLLSKNF
ncbi:hypothetical protein F5J12DRAFT_933530 [Pisolithus orientalis]|uniref:uncharacterized protein n=1 Tax=Pisolithus orientalis TaxID=936130 RepID=UPI0022257236|nr:uncharacterized protein F5J12DRAFT_933530 [Pisolithus orientalis]KAI6035324.1 hypothetical protein F5J12DRAFT_933530 [Pisolithus orientalis]